jgi:hypothetical protein
MFNLRSSDPSKQSSYPSNTRNCGIHTPDVSHLWYPEVQSDELKKIDN